MSYKIASKNKGSQKGEQLLKTGSLHWISYTCKVIGFVFGELGAISFFGLTNGNMCCTYGIVKHQNIGYSHNKDRNNGNANDGLNTYRCECSFIRVDTTVARWKFKNMDDQMVNMPIAEDNCILEIVEQSVVRGIQPNGKSVSVRATGNENGQQMIESLTQGFRVSSGEIHGIQTRRVCDWMDLMYLKVLLDVCNSLQNACWQFISTFDENWNQDVIFGTFFYDVKISN